MKKVTKKVFLLMLIPLALSQSLQLEANIITDQFKKVKDFYVSFKNAKAEYQKAYKEHTINILKNCSQEINALAKAADDINKTSPLLDPLLFGHLVIAKEVAQDQLNACIAERCKDSKEKMDQAWAQYSPKIPKVIGGIVLLEVGILGGIFATIKCGSLAQFYYKQYCERAAERIRIAQDEIALREQADKQQALRLRAQSSVEEIINGHGIANEPQIDMIKEVLTDFMTTDNVSTVPIPAHLELPISVIAAIAEAIHGRMNSDTIMNNIENLDQFMRFIHQQQQLSL